jgi:cytochrome c oxidase subunit III
VIVMRGVAHASAGQEGGRGVFRDDRTRFLAERQGIGLFLLSLAVLFAASWIGYVVIRVQIPWPDDLPSLPGILWLSTLVLAASSAAVQAALNAVRNGSENRAASMMLLTTLLGAVFLALQTVAWIGWLDVAAARWPDSEPHRWALSSFYVLTGLHAAHVIGGVLPMILITARAFAGRYSPQRHTGIYFCAVYWHFLGGVWAALFLTLLIAQ